MRASCLVAFVAFVVLAAVACGAPAPARPALVAADAATPLPPLSLRLLSGEPWSPAASAGRVLVLDVWATYCEPCRDSFPKLDRLATTYPDVDVVAISVDEEDAVVHRFLAEVPARFTIARDPEMTVREPPLGITRLPTVLVVDRRGRVRFRAEELPEERYDALPALVEELRAE